MDEIDSRLHKQGSVLDQMFRRSAERLQRANDLQALVDRVLGPAEEKSESAVLKSSSERQPTHEYKSIVSSRRYRAAKSVSADAVLHQQALPTSPANAQPRVRPSSPPQRHFVVLDESSDTRNKAPPREEERFQKVLEEAKAVKEQRAAQQQRADALLSMQRLRALAAKDLNTYSDLVHNQQKQKKGNVHHCSKGSKGESQSGKAAGGGETYHHSKIQTVRERKAAATHNTHNRRGPKARSSADRGVVTPPPSAVDSSKDFNKSMMPASTPSVSSATLAGALEALEESQRRIASMMSV